MCVRYVGVDPRKDRVQERLGLIYGIEPKGSETFPGDAGEMLLPSRELVAARWGMQPAWADDPNWGRKRAYNARSETIRERPTFRAAILRRRCVVAAESFYERNSGRWLRISPEDGEPILIASIYEPPNDWTELPTYALVTTEPNGRIAPLHDRMPVVLDLDGAAAWLDPATPAREIDRLMIPCPDELLTIEDAGPVGGPRRKEPAAGEPSLEI